MKVSELAKDLEIELEVLQERLEKNGMNNTHHACTVDPDLVAQIRREYNIDKTPEKVASPENDKGYVTELPSGKKVIILFSERKSLMLALKDTSIQFINNQLIIDADKKNEMLLYDSIMKIGSPYIFIVASKPYPKGPERADFDKKIEDWLFEKGPGASGGMSFRGSTMLQALFHAEEQNALAERPDFKAGLVGSPRALKAEALERKSLVHAKY